MLVAVGLAGGAGAAGRVLLDGVAAGMAARTRGFPVGTLVVNLSGAFLLGLLAGLSLGTSANRLLGTGLIGGFTTFSTWMYETHRLAEQRRPGLAAINLVVSLIGGVVLAWAGSRLGLAL